MNSCVYARNNMAEVKVDILLLTEKFVNDIAGCSVSNCVYLLQSQGSSSHFSIMHAVTCTLQKMNRISLLFHQCLVIRKHFSLLCLGVNLIFCRVDYQTPASSLAMCSDKTCPANQVQLRGSNAQGFL